jgi:hypothetical protein
VTAACCDRICASADCTFTWAASSSVVAISFFSASSCAATQLGARICEAHAQTLEIGFGANQIRARLFNLCLKQGGIEPGHHLALRTSELKSAFSSRMVPDTCVPT